jgi:hypothetical protein
MIKLLNGSKNLAPAPARITAPARILSPRSRTNPFVWLKEHRQRIKELNLANWRGFFMF